VKFYKEMKRHYYTTPSSYLELLKLYQNLLKIKNMEIIAKRKRIANGLNKLLETNEVVCDVYPSYILDFGLSSNPFPDCCHG